MEAGRRYSGEYLLSVGRKYKSPSLILGDMSSSLNLTTVRTLNSWDPDSAIFNFRG